MKEPLLNRPLILEAPQNSSDGAGGFSFEWAALGTVWAELELRSAREARGAAGALSVNAYRVTVRGAPVGHPQRPQVGQRFRDGSRIFRIQGVGERDTSGKYLTCSVEEEIAA
jgi:head-tail adaptor